MGRSYQPVQSWAIMVEIWSTEIVIELRKPARPEDALSEGAFDRSATMKMDPNVASTNRNAINLQKWASDNDR